MPRKSPSIATLATADVETQFDKIAVCLVAVCVVLQVFSRFSVAPSKKAGTETPAQKAALSGLYTRYLSVWLLFKAADWLQGPYFHDVYSSKTIDGNPVSEETVGRLFLTGFLSSAIFSATLAPIVDRRGRKLGCLAFAVLYAMNALSAYSSSMPVLVAGRVASGAATSLLFSAPESWMVSEHARLKLPGSTLDGLFSLAYFLDAIVAIAAGQAAEFASKYTGSATGAYGLSAVCAVVGGIVLLLSGWIENRGQATQERPGATRTRSQGAVDGASTASPLRTLMSNGNVMAVGCVQAAFEGAMYVFVLVWGPLVASAIGAASSGNAGTPFGKIFSCFMCACMCGSSLAALLSTVGLSTRLRMLPMLLCASAALFLASQPNASWLKLSGCFLLFEVAVGLYFPTIGALRSNYVPDEHRALVLNFVRLPLNGIVVAVTLCRSMIGNVGALQAAAAAVLLAAAMLVSLRPEAKAKTA